MALTQGHFVHSPTARRWHTLNINPTAAIVVVLAIMVAGALGGWYYVSAAKTTPCTEATGPAPGAGQAPGDDGGTTDEEGKEPGTTPPAGGAQAAQCAGPLSEKSRITLCL